MKHVARKSMVGLEEAITVPIQAKVAAKLCRNNLFGKKSKRQSPFGLFESYREKRISLCFMSRLGKLVHFSGRMRLRMKLIAKKELILLFQKTLSRILCDQ